MENVNTRSEYKSIAAQFAAAKEEAKKNKIKKIQPEGDIVQKVANRFKSLHLATVIFFSWILCVVFMNKLACSC